MSSSLWPNFASLAVPRGMREMLLDAAGDISGQTSGKIDFHIDAVGVGISGAVLNIRYNCYLKVVKNNYIHLLFRVTTPAASPFPAVATTPEGEEYPGLADENALRDAIRAILQRARTTEVVLHLLTTAK